VCTKIQLSRLSLYAVCPILLKVGGMKRKFGVE
jgi:hypothetical protein